MLLVLAFPISASAATIKTIKDDNNYVKLSQKQLLSEDGVVIKLQENEAVQVEYPDGSIEVFTYKLEPTSNNAGARANRFTGRASVIRGIMSASLELWGDATWENRSVSFDDEAYLDFWGLSTSVEEDVTWVSQRSGSSNAYAKARTRGVCTTTEPVSGVEYTVSFDFEMWLDPADSTNCYIHINK